MGVGVPMSDSPTGSVPGDTRRGVAIRITILSEQKQPLKQQSLARITNQSTGRILFETSRGTEVVFPNLPPGKYKIEVGAAGYVAMHGDVSIPDLAHDVSQSVYLARDPAAVNFSLGDAGELPAKAHKEATKGVLALELGNFVEARKYLEAADRQYPTSSNLKFLLAYEALQQKDEDRELQYLLEATKLDPQNLQAQNLLGQLYYRREDYAHAAEAESIVVARSADSVRARKVLATSYLKLKQFEKAREQAQWLVDHGGTEGTSARLILGQAMVGLGQYEAAIPVLQAYLDDDPASSVAGQTRQLISQLQQNAGKVNASISDPDLEAGTEALLKAGMPQDVDSQKPNVAAGVQCPTNLMQMTANPAKLLVDSVAQFSAIEHMSHENITLQGIPRNRETRDYNYVVSISEPANGALTVQEYRDSGNLAMPDQITTTGLPVLAIAFHPLFRDDFDWKCEGLGDWQGQAAWLVHFRQLDDKPSRLRSYVVNKNNYPVGLKGRAWISADNFQILHLQTDLVKPIPEIRLVTEHTSVTYGPVQFRRHGTDLWLPKSAELYVVMGKRRFHRSENFDHFMLFATDTMEAAKPPKTESAPPPVPNSGPSLND
jgi:tetratricopeptide (TPR) repeat protein